MKNNREKTERQLKVEQELLKITQDFFQREADRSSMITVTAADINPSFKNATIKISVFPENKRERALIFAQRMAGELRTDIKRRLPIRTIPFVDIVIDQGEIQRQYMDNKFNEIK
ncbi:MAG: ribosome-binding factor A [Candidatus Pacebacteria bacterium]|nr:ribosome-binding factor A [Candidatus Paceibacterota bacterium]